MNVFAIYALVFLGYVVVSNECLKIDTNKVKIIVCQIELDSIHEVQSFHGLASFYPILLVVHRKF